MSLLILQTRQAGKNKTDDGPTKMQETKDQRERKKVISDLNFLASHGIMLLLLCSLIKALVVVLGAMVSQLKSSSFNRRSKNWPHVTKE